jgi:hypothetical protein
VDEVRLEGIALILHAIDEAIADVEARDEGDSSEQAETLRHMRASWTKKGEAGPD